MATVLYKNKKVKRKIATVENVVPTPSLRDRTSLESALRLEIKDYFV